MPQPIVKIKDLDITYNLGKENEFKATRGVNMEVYPGEFVAFFGPSGCGKSTIFYSILGILEPSAGQLLVKGENPYSFSPEEMVRFQTKIIGIVYQAFYLITSLSVIDNVVLPQIFHGVNPGKRRRWAKQVLKRFGMEEHGDKYPDNLSGGQSQRVSVARAMVNNPNILLADEPTGNLDSTSTKQVMDSMAEINSVDKKTVIMITHNAAQLSYCHRVFYLRDGKLERVVPNPEKKQIAKIDKHKILITEFDQLSKLFPYEDPITLKVKSLVNYLTQDINYYQLQRLEDIIKLVVERKISQKEFKSLVMKNYNQGGIDLTESLAAHMSEKIYKIIRQSEDIRRFRRRFLNSNFFSRENVLVRNLAKFVMDEYKKELSLVQRRRLKDLVYKRITGLISRRDFKDALRVELPDGGVGLGKVWSRKLTRYFEKLLMQGTDSKGHH